MIEISPMTAVMMYLFLTIGVLLGAWGYGHYQQRNRKLVTSDLRLTICEYCLFAYLADSSKKISKCPQCSCFNKE